MLDRTDSGGETVAAEYYYLNGNQIGSVTNNGPDQYNYAQAIVNENSTSTSPPSGASADIDGTLTELGSNAPAAAASSYTVRAGDTLQSIAQNVWGDANLWYLIANANGLSPNQPLSPGQMLSLPNDVINIANTSGAFKPYSPSQATGNINPTPRRTTPAAAGAALSGISSQSWWPWPSPSWRGLSGIWSIRSLAPR